MELQRAAADRLGAQGRDEHHPRRRTQLDVAGGEARLGVEACLEPPVDLGEVLAHAMARVRMGHVHGPDLHRAGREEALDLVHRRHEPAPLLLVERLQERQREPVAAPVELGPLAPAPGCQAGGPGPPVPLAGLDRDEARALEGAEHAAEVAGVEREPRAEHTEIAPAGADLPQQPGLSERPVAGEEAIVEGSDALGHEPVEPPHLGHAGVAVHSLTVVRHLPCGQDPAAPRSVRPPG